MIEQGQKLNKDLISVAGLVSKEYHGPTEFSRKIDFGQTFEFMRESLVSIKERIRENSFGLEFLGFENEVVKQIYNEITRIANNTTPDNPDARYRYQLQLKRFFSFLEPETEGSFIAIKRAGSLVARFYPKTEVYEIEGKRLPMKNKELSLGLIGELPVEQFQGERVVVGEGCVATGITIAGILNLIKEKEVRPEIIEVHALAVSQFGANFLLEHANGLKLPLVIKGGMPVYAMNEVFYLMRTKEEGFSEETFAVGDCGDYSFPLPVEFNTFAWWNWGRTTS